ncbi:MAG: amino acid dehydrogenase [Cytophagales bacterium]|nr:amino acid dehydrogenase [Cytophagales bacterium]
MGESLSAFESRFPEIVFAWQDSLTEARGWLVIHSLRGGAAGGGTRMRKGLNQEEVLSLAKTMEIKFAFSGPPIGGAKSGIDFDPQDPRKEGVLFRWYQAIFPLLQTYYGTGGDLNLSEAQEVRPITQKLGLPHPQTGILMGFYKPTEAQKKRKLWRLETGVGGVVEDLSYAPKGGRQGYSYSDMVTGYGVAESIRIFYELWGKGVGLQGKRALIQGWGNVGAATAFYLSRWGVRVVGVMDKRLSLYKSEGLSVEEVESLFVEREGNVLPSLARDLLSEVGEDIWEKPVDIFVPAAASGLLDRAIVEKLCRHVEIVSCGANVPFQDEEIFYGSIMRYVDERVALIPDFLANLGMARTFAFLMNGEDSFQGKDLFQDISEVLHKNLKEIFLVNSIAKFIARTALKIGLQRINGSETDLDKS